MFARRDVPRADVLPFGSLSSADVVHIQSAGEPDLVNGPPPEPQGSRSLTCNGILGAINSTLFNMNDQSASINKIQLRQQIRLLRQQLSKEQCLKAGQQLAQQFNQHFVDYDFQTIGIYLQNDNELDTSVLIEYFFQSSVQVYLPKVYEDGSNQLQFLHYHPKSKMQNNRFGIPEPVTEDKIDLQNIDLLLMPLTAFDLSGNRIGMGGGYYDRTLSKLFNKKPLLVGIAYDFQQVERCPVESFDQPLQMILTPTRTVAFNH